MLAGNYGRDAKDDVAGGHHPIRVTRRFAAPVRGHLIKVRPAAIPPRRRAAMVCALAVGAALLAAGLLSAAILVPAPAAVLPLLGVVCVGFPMLAAWELARVDAALGGLGLALRRGRPLDERALSELRRALERLPETVHPLDR